MQEIIHIWLKYEEDRLLDSIQSLEDVNQFALTFGKDVAYTFKLVTLLQILIRTLTDMTSPAHRLLVF